MDITSQLRAAITSQNFPPPSPSLLTSLITARSPPPPLPSLLATAKARLLACDITSSSLVDGSQLAPLPSNADSANTKEIKLQNDVHLQVVDVENLSLSRWEQVEELEAIERGERTRGREVIRVTADEDAATQGPGAGATTQNTNGAAPTAGKNAVHRLTLQDHKRSRVYAVELKRIDAVGVAKTSIGCKILLRAGSVVARGTVLLTPENCVVLGGKIDVWHEDWTKGRLARLKEAAGGDAAR